MKWILALSFLVTQQALALVPGKYTGKIDGKKIEAVVEQSFKNGKKQEYIHFLDTCAPKSCGATYKVVRANSFDSAEHGKLIALGGSQFSFLDLTTYREHLNKRPGFDVTVRRHGEITLMMDVNNRF